MKNQNESPFGNPRFLATLAITFLGLWGWQYYMNKKYPQPKPAEVVQTNAAATGAAQQQPTTEQKQLDANKVGGQNNSSMTAASVQATSLPQTETKTFEYSNEHVAFTVSSNGFGLKQFTVKDYKDRDGQFVKYEPVIPLFAVVHKNTPVQFSVTQKSETEFFGEATVDGKKVTRSLRFDPATYAMHSEINYEPGIDSLQVDIEQKKLVYKNTNFLMPSFEHQDFIFVNDGKTNSESISTLKNGEGLLKTTGNVSMASISTQYFTTAFVNKSDFLPSITKKVDGNNALLTIDYDLKNLKSTQIKETFYVGAKKTEILSAIDPQMEEVLNYGMFGAISKILLRLLKFMHQILGNWGLAIIGMTLIVRLILMPFNVMSFRSAQSMQKIKPQMDALRERYKGDPMRMNQETMALMKKNKANPVSGCLPMLLQIPIFFALWRAISSSVELYQQPFFGWITDLSSHDKFFVLPILMGITMFLQQKMTPTTMDPTQAKILNFMPIIFTLFMVTLPSGLTLYNFVSALFGVTQQYFLLKQKNNNSAALKPA